jgi:kynureninase
MAEDLTGINEAQQLDSSDPLRGFRREFYFPPKGQLYMDGNSLGLLSKRAEATVNQTMDDWRQFGVSGWTQGEHPWFYLAEELSALEAPLVGARPDEIIVANSTSVNLNQILATFYNAHDGRSKVIVDESAFPSDIYAIKSRMHQMGVNPNENLFGVKNREGLIEEEDIIKMMDQNRDSTAMLVLPTVIYTTGQLLNVSRLTAEAHVRGIQVCFDASHSVGVVPHQFSEDGVDSAIWCNYKYVNGGPGAIGGLYINERHLGTQPGLAGWFGSAKSKQFDMSHDPTYAQGAGAYQIGTPAILAAAPLRGSLEMIHEAGIEVIREKSLKMTGYMLDLIDQQLTGFGFTTATPKDPNRHGGHVSITHPHAAQINKALIQHGVIPDFRPPNIVRLAPIALYTSYEDIHKTIQILKGIMSSGEYTQLENQRGIVA